MLYISLYQKSSVVFLLAFWNLLVIIFSAVMMRAVGRGAFKIVEEVRRQFREIPGIMGGESETRVW